VSDYYDLLGVDAGADKDTIKAAYREQLDGATQAERAKLNKAWNVLSDPVQRERYDDARSEGWLDDAEGGDDADTGPAPARSGGRGGAGASSRQRPARPAPEPTVVLPEGMELADPRSRGMALLIDFGILFVIYIVALSVVLPALLKNQYPVQTKKIDAINKQIKTLDDQKSKLDDKAGKAHGAAKTSFENQAKAKQKQIDKKNTQITNIAKDFQTFALLMYAVLLAIFLLYAVPSTAISGKTLGMRLRHVRVVRADGSPVTWAGAFGRFVVPFAVALLLPQLGAVIGLGMVLWFLRDKNRQGVHDKIARTLVVAD
jgi:uncharacterized RDD family membrane protein YckC